MRERFVRVRGGGIVADDGLDIDWTPDHFDPEHWRRLGRTVAEAEGGRGSVMFVDAGAEGWALRHYRRGGMVSRVLYDHYLWQGAARTRSVREWRLLRELFGQGLPVPRPVAAAYARRGMSYTADLITRRVAGARALATHLAEAALPDRAWRRLGACVRRFHEAGVCHADLTAHNLLLDHAGQPWILDFDRGRIRPPGAWQRSNLLRLRRSLNKVSMADEAVQFAPGNWRAFLAGYDQMPA